MGSSILVVIALTTILFEVGAGNSTIKSNNSCRQAVYHVATLQQSYNCCHNYKLNGRADEDLKSQYSVLQKRLTIMEKQLASFLKQNTKCEDALINGDIPIQSSQFSASSTYPFDTTCHAPRSTLHSNGSGAWCAARNSNSQWIQVDFRKITQVTAIATQGRALAVQLLQWVSLYTVSFSNNGANWRQYMEDGLYVKIFAGNWDGTTVNKYYLKEAVRARFIRLNPRTWNRHISLRWEVYGCTV